MSIHQIHCLHITASSLFIFLFPNVWVSSHVLSLSVYLSNSKVLVLCFILLYFIMLCFIIIPKKSVCVLIRDKEGADSDRRRDEEG